MSKLAQKVLLAVLCFVFALGFISLGVWIGFGIKDRSLRERLDEAMASRTLGDYIAGRAPEGVIGAYLDPEEAREKLSEYTWSIPTVPTPFVGTAPQPGSFGNSTINQLQFRDDRKIPKEKPPETVRVFLTGGSAAFGVGAPSQDETLGALVENRLNRIASDRGHWEVFTFACPSWTTTHERIAIENRLSELSPDLVVSFSGFNDIYWASQGRNVLWSRSHQESYFYLLNRAVHQAYDSWRLTDVEDRREDPIDPEAVAYRVEKNVRLAAAALRPSGAPYLFALQPSLYFGRKPLTTRERIWLREEQKAYYEKCYEMVSQRLDGIEEAGIEICSLADVFDSLGDTDEIYIDSVHLGDRGNRILAESLAQRVLDTVRRP